MKTFRYKDLDIGFVTKFDLMWNDRKSGGNMNGAYYRPIIPEEMEGFHSLGDLGYVDWIDVNKTAVIAVAKDVKDPSGTALRAPIKFEKIWDDRGSEARMNGSMWRPIPPDSYVALGVICNNSWSPPSVDVVRCVRADLVVPAYPGDLIWRDTKTGAKTDFSSWRTNPPDAPSGGGEIFLSPGTFIGAPHHHKPDKDPNAYALRLLIEEKTPSNPAPPVPVLHDYSKPSPFEKDTVTYSSILPWFTVMDPNLTPIDQLVKCPEYRLERVDCYKLIGHGQKNLEFRIQNSELPKPEVLGLK